VAGPEGPIIETLEARQLFSTAVVTTTSDISDGDTGSIAALITDPGSDGSISLREAILAANNTPNGAVADTIAFDIAGAGVHTIALDSELPYLTDEVILDATTQAGGSFTTPLIYLTKSDAYTGGDTAAIMLRADNSTVRGFIVGGFGDDGIEIDGSTGSGDDNLIELNHVGFDAAGGADGVGDEGVLISGNADRNVIRQNVIGSSGALTSYGDGIRIDDRSDSNWVWGNLIGLAPDGVTPRGNVGLGIYVQDKSNANRIGTNGDGTDDGLERNIIAFSHTEGIRIDNSDGTLILGNLIGNDGVSDLGNTRRGVFVNDAPNTQIGNGTAAGRNVIAGNDAGNININGSSSTGTTILGNYVGLNAAGDAAIASGGPGISVSGGAVDTVIGGKTTGHGNVVSGSSGHGIVASHGSGTVIRGNYIGTDATGLRKIANSAAGVVGVNAVGLKIGGDQPGEGNVISGNTNSGIYLDQIDGASILGNFVGVGADGTSPIGNGDGIHLDGSVTDTEVGRITAGAGNLIAHNSTVGVLVKGATSTGNTVRGNVIRDHPGLAIDLGGDGVSANDAGDPDPGANRLQNAPEPQTARTDGSAVTITGVLQSGATRDYLVDFYATATAAASGQSEAGRYLGSATVTTDGLGRAFYDVTFAQAVSSGELITATATDSATGDTSELGPAPIAATSGDPPVATDDPVDLSTYVESLSPLSLWRLGEASGTTAVDAGSEGNDGTYIGAVTHGQSGAVIGSSDTSVRFNGADQYVQVSHDADYLIDSGTVQAWFNTDAIGVRQDIFSKDDTGYGTGGHLSVWIATDGVLTARLQTPSTSYTLVSAATVTASTWHHTAVSFGENGFRLYLDGEEIARSTYTGGWGASSGGTGNEALLSIGAGRSTAAQGAWSPMDYFFDGVIDEVAIFGSQLDANAVNRLYSAGSQPAYQVSEDGALSVAAAGGVLPNDFDADGDALTVVEVNGAGSAVGNQVTLPSGALLTLNADGSFDYDVNGGFDDLAAGATGTETFSYTVSDGTSTDTAQVSITIDGVNDPGSINTGHGDVTAEFGGLTTKTTIGKATLIADDLIAVDTGLTYGLSVTASAANIDPSEYHYIGFTSHDSDGFAITGYNYGLYGGAAQTTLAVDLVAGATQIVLNDATGWYNGASSNGQSLAWYGYTNRDGYTYADYTYTRNLANDIWDAGAISGNVITLSSAWTGPTLLAGQAVGNSFSPSGTYQYALLSASAIPAGPTTYTSTIGGGEIVGGAASNTLFRPGTAYIKPLVLANYTDTTTELTISNFTVEAATGTTIFTEDGPAVGIFEGNGQVTDPDDLYTESITIQLTNGKIGDLLNVDEPTINALGISVAGVPGGALTADGAVTLTLTSDAADTVTHDDYEAALAAITFENLSDDPDTTDRVMTLVQNDGDDDSATETLIIQVLPVDDAPIASITGDSPTWTENGGGVGVFSNASIDLVEAGDLVSSLMLTVAGVVDGSAETLTVDGQAIQLTDLFTATTLANGYTVDVAVSGTTATVTVSKAAGFTSHAAETLLDGIAYNNTREDPSGATRTVAFVSVTEADLDGVNDTATVGTSSVVTVTAVNDAPVLGGSNPVLDAITEDDVSNTGHTVNEIIARLGTNAVTDAEGDPIGIAIHVNNGNGGTWQYRLASQSDWSDVGTVSNGSSLLLSGLDSVRLLPNTEEGSPANLGFRAWDQTSGAAGTYVSVMPTGGSSAFSLGAKSAQVSVSDVNDAPVYDTTGTSTLTTVTEDQTSNAGQTVASIIGSAGGDRVTDVDSNPVEGIAITATTSGNGSWQYSTTSGSTWSDVDTVSNTSALLLSSSDLVRFVPNGQSATTGSITFRAWDQTSGTRGTKVTTAVNGGTSAFSAAIEDAQITVTDVNDAPTGSVTIDDTTPTQGDTLTASNTLADPDGLGTITYTWKADGATVGTGVTYVVTEAEVDKVITVEASYTDGQGTPETVSSAATAAVVNVNDAPTGSVTIDDTTPTQGDTLTASNTLADPDGLGTITYTWKADGTTVGTGATYTVTESEVDKVITVEASYTDGHGTPETVSSAATAAVVNVNDAPTGSVTIDDTTPTQGDTLTASNTLADADGLGTITYTWKANGVTVGTGSTYTVTEAEVDKTITVEASYTDGHGTPETVSSAATAAVVNVNDAPTGSVTIDDTTPTQGDTLTASNTLADPDGLGTITYTWKADGTTVGTGATYTVTESEVDKVITVEASYTDGHGTPETVSSAATAAVVNVNDAPTGSVTIDDTTPTQGDTLTASNTLADPDGLGTINYTWKANGSTVGTGSTFTVTESEVGQSITVEASYTDGHGTPETVSSAATAAVIDVNDAPTVTLTNAVITLPEDAATTPRVKVADIVVTDDALGVNDLTLTGADAALFEIDGNELYLVAGTALDFETNPTLDVTVQVDDATVGANPDDTAALAIAVTDINEAPSVTLANTTTTLPEDAATTPRVKVADIVVTDDALGSETLALTGADAAFFEISGNELYLVAGAALDFETNPTLDVTVQVDDTTVGANPDDTAALAIAVTDVNEAPSVTLTNATTTLPEDAATTPRVKVADIVVTDDALGANDLTLTGADAALFEVSGNELYLMAGAALDFETNPTLDVTVQVDDAAVGASPDDNAALAIAVTDVNEAPAVALVNTFTTLAEDPSTPRARVADIVVSDDALGTYTLSLTGADVAFFEIDGNELYLRAGTDIDFETNPVLDVTVRVDDPAIGGTPDDTADLVINVVDVNETPFFVNNRLTINGGETVTLTRGDLFADDPDDTPEQRVFTVDTWSGGRFELGTSPGVAVTSFTQDQVDRGEVRFVQLTPTRAPAYTLTVSDGALSDGPMVARIDFTPATIPTGPTEPVGPTLPTEPAITDPSADGPEVTPPAVDPPAAPTPVRFNATVPTTNPTPTSTSAPTPEPTPETTPDPTPDSTPDSTPELEPASESASEPAPEPAPAPEPEPAAEAAREPSPEPEPEPTTNREPVDATTPTPAIPAGQPPATSDSRTGRSLERWTPRTVRPIVNEGVADTLAEVRDQFDAIEEEQTRREQLVVGRAVTVSGLLSAGYLAWMFRGASILAGVLSSIPVWKMIDPLAVLPAPQPGVRPRRWWQRKPPARALTPHEVDTDFLD